MRLAPAARALPRIVGRRPRHGTARSASSQPLIEPLYDGKTPDRSSLAPCSTEVPRGGHEIAREAMRPSSSPALDFDGAWRRALHDGFLAGSAVTETVRTDASGRDRCPRLRRWRRRTDGDSRSVFRPDYAGHDGRFANNGWLQELPDPLTKLTWDNAALIAPPTAERLAVRGRDVSRAVAVGDARSSCRSTSLPGQAAGSIARPLGYGRSAAGRVGDGVGFDAYRCARRRRCTRPGRR